MTLMNNFTLETLASAMQTHLLLPSAQAREDARHIWEVELRRAVPQTLDEVEALIDTLVSLLVVDVLDSAPIPQYTAKVRALLGEFMAPKDANAAIKQFRTTLEPHADKVIRARREWNVQHPVGARAIKWTWRIYWFVAIASTGLFIGLAIASGIRENVIVAAILPPGVFGILAGAMAAVLSSIRKEPSDPLDG